MPPGVRHLPFIVTLNETGWIRKQLTSLPTTVNFDFPSGSAFIFFFQLSCTGSMNCFYFIKTNNLLVCIFYYYYFFLHPLHSVFVTALQFSLQSGIALVPVSRLSPCANICDPDVCHEKFGESLFCLRSDAFTDLRQCHHTTGLGGAHSRCSLSPSLPSWRQPFFASRPGCQHPVSRLWKCQMNISWCFF